MLGRIRRWLGLGGDRRSVSRALPVAPPLPSTRGELTRTAAAHRRRLLVTDRFLREVESLDGALRLHRPRR